MDTSDLSSLQMQTVVTWLAGHTSKDMLSRLLHDRVNKQDWEAVIVLARVADYV